MVVSGISFYLFYLSVFLFDVLTICISIASRLPYFGSWEARVTKIVWKLNYRNSYRQNGNGTYCHNVITYSF